MAAVLGWFHVAAGYHFIGDAAAGERVSDNPLINVTQLPMGGMWQLVFTILCVEWAVTYVCKPSERRPWDIFGWNDVVADEEFPDWKSAQLQELNNGRLAMMGILGLVVQDVLFGDYAAGIGQACFGAEICKKLGTDSYEYWPSLPSAPYNWPALWFRLRHFTLTSTQLGNALVGERKAHANLARLAANNDKMWLMLANLIERVRGGPHSAAKAMRKEMPSKPVADMAQEAPVSTTYLSTVELQHAAHEVSVLAASFSKELCRDEQEALAYLHMARIGDNHEKVMTRIKECLSGFNLIALIRG
ncbi:unnamed protein product [Polarella glacialis]|uniref:Uncharacterized protein n=1 Tax=Polarella glacialis TaxID=89957 RepID=A0A813HSA9_POLGL|nr:unnamed protein product [Polarella glacialis]